MEQAKILICGDLFPRRSFELFSQGKIDQLFSPEITELLRTADYSVCNLEGVLTEYDIKNPKCGPNIKAPPETVAVLRALGIDCVSMANNHTTDFGTRGYSDTCKVLAENKIDYFGAGINESSIKKHFPVTIKGKKIVFYAVAETVFNIPAADKAGVNLYDEYRVCNEIRKLKQSCDCLIVLYHGGVEFFQYPTPWVRTRFHRMADSGADCIIAQHTHCIGAEEEYKGAYLLYGQGNFHLIQARTITLRGILLELVLSDGKMDVKHHLIVRDGDRVNYDPQQNLSDFQERSRRIAEGDTFEAEFSEYSAEWMLKWLLEFRGLRLWDRVLRKLLSEKAFGRYLRKRYKDVTVLRMLEHVRGEEDIEVMQRGLSDFFYLK